MKLIKSLFLLTILLTITGGIFFLSADIPAPTKTITTTQKYENLSR